MSASAPPLEVINRFWPYLVTFLTRLGQVPWPTGAYATSWWRGEIGRAHV